ncbi:BTB/POZ and MATH domain-containing protein 2-like [Panicum virgatum]|uniref:Uncharacterized protein n=1 Tax=Panicum virgatum TaxID=38727 RepID=A0A8T0SM84_PANVG|nr:BTB/POZ and MATH domain-containing protein 2-like [Panicum virgatum]KAG2598235.1 hypothetical protein PVAP13_5KG313007 [Panicum virgatum]
MDKRRSETTSRLVTTSAQATHNFEVTDFSLLEGMGAGRYVSSRTFTAGGRAWNIRLYPDGEVDKAAYASVFLCLVGGAKDARTNYTLELLDKDGEVSHLQDQGTTTMKSNTFGAPFNAWGFRNFVEKSKLKTLLCRNGDDGFTIRCVLTVVGESVSEDVRAVAVPPSDMHQHFERMLKDGRGADVAFNVDGQLFRAHRCVLAARSPVFAAELFGPMKEKDTAEPIKVDGLEPCVFEELLLFMYTDRISDDGKRGADDKNAAAQHLLVAADRYGLDRLRQMCEAKLCRGIDARTVATTLALAEQHRCARLKYACLAYVASRDVLGAVMKTDGFKHLAASCPLVLVEILDAIVKGKDQ